MSLAGEAVAMRTSRQQAGDEAEAAVAARLARHGWTILATRLRVGRAEIDLLAVDPGPPAALVAVEVRWRRRRDYGLAEQTVDHRKRGRLRVALYHLLDGRRLPDGRPVPRLTIRLDIVALDLDGEGRVALRHHRGVAG